MNKKANEATFGGQFTFPGTTLTVNRVGYGAMQLTGPGIYDPPKDPDGAVAILREAVAAGVNHIDTSDYYGPHITNQIIRRALHPYPTGLVIDILCVITNDATVKTILQLCHPPQAVAASHAGSPARSGPARTRGRGDCGACAV
jgi:hypothetical protein